MTLLDPTPLPYGILAEFRSSIELLRAARAVQASGYRNWEAYTPFPVEGLAEVAGFERSKMPLVVLVGAIVGGTLGFALQYWISVIDYPLNIGGRPLNSWPAFIPVTFELTILGGALFAVLGMLGLNGLPRPHHPLFAVPTFRVGDGYYLCVQSSDPLFHTKDTRELLTQFNAILVSDVPDDS